MRGTQTLTVIRDALGLACGLVRPACLLRVVKGPDKRRQKRMATSRVVLGSSPGADLVLTDPTVSALHCEVLLDAQGFRVRDLGSKNGVRVGGIRVSEAWLAHKHELELGRTRVRFELLDEEESQPLSPRRSFGRLRGSSARMQELYALLARAAASDAPVFLQGETGTGKELAADALVSEGPRRDGPLVVVDCGRLPPTLAESELFGHEPGAFTGAARQHIGAFERAHGGTLFLDEVGELPLDLQVKLLGALERREVRRLGGEAPIAVDVRVISATHRRLEREVNQGRFRADLFYRLVVIQVELPPLRERAEDIPELVAHFLDELGAAGKVSPGALAQLYERDWPGNVRELRNAVERLTVGLELEPSLRAVPPATAVDLEVPYALQKQRVVQGFERAYVAELLRVCEGNVSEAARRAGMNRVHLHQLLRRLGLSGR